MVKVQLWTNVSGLWNAQLIDPITEQPEALVFKATSRGAVIAEVSYRLPLTHLNFVDRLCVTDP
jgi:hypothetical protein